MVVVLPCVRLVWAYAPVRVLGLEGSQLLGVPLVLDETGRDRGPPCRDLLETCSWHGLDTAAYAGFEAHESSPSHMTGICMKLAKARR